ncbi:type IIL restriction-modification enzyme MmeI, partial [Aquimonas sp.]|uniref:type IIL restriction-modification enzyme MmeI n=1 Tax=Aquimonas sp. TaxID=1872588 RepID=UPI0037BFE1C4
DCRPRATATSTACCRSRAGRRSATEAQHGEWGSGRWLGRTHTDDKARSAIETAAQTVLDARAAFPDSTLADLYDPLSMPPALVKAHQQLDRAVDAAYAAVEKAAGRKAPKLGTDAERVAFLFERYQALTSLLPAEKPKRGRAKPSRKVEEGAD